MNQHSASLVRTSYRIVDTELKVEVQRHSSQLPGLHQLPEETYLSNQLQLTRFCRGTGDQERLY